MGAVVDIIALSLLVRVFNVRKRKGTTLGGLFTIGMGRAAVVGIAAGCLLVFLRIFS